jgi:hypothetical protein
MDEFVATRCHSLSLLEKQFGQVSELKRLLAIIRDGRLSERKRVIAVLATERGIRNSLLFCISLESLY